MTDGSLLCLLVICPFGIPFFAGLFILVGYWRNSFTWLAVLLTWKPLVATWLVLWVGSEISPYDAEGFSILKAMVAISPAVLITLWLVYLFRDVVFRSTARKAAWMLLVLDTIRWGNTFALLTIAPEAALDRTTLLIYIGLFTPTILAVVAVSLVGLNEDLEFLERKKKKKKRRPS